MSDDKKTGLTGDVFENISGGAGDIPSAKAKCCICGKEGDCLEILVGKPVCKDCISYYASIHQPLPLF